MANNLSQEGLEICQVRKDEHNKKTKRAAYTGFSRLVVVYPFRFTVVFNTDVRVTSGMVLSFASFCRSTQKSIYEGGLQANNPINGQLEEKQMK